MSELEPDAEAQWEAVNEIFDARLIDLRGTNKLSGRLPGHPGRSDSGLYRPRGEDHPMYGQSPVSRYVASLGDFATTKEVAERIGMSQGWVKKAARQGWTQAPSFAAYFGQKVIYLFTSDDIAALGDYVADRYRMIERSNDA